MTRRTSNVLQAAELNMEECPSCKVASGDPCRTPQYRACKPHASRWLPTLRRYAMRQRCELVVGTTVLSIRTPQSMVFTPSGWHRLNVWFGGVGEPATVARAARRLLLDSGLTVVSCIKRSCRVCE